MRIVFDTNSIISALLFEHSTPGQAFHQALKHGQILMSPSTLEELSEVLGREKFDRYVSSDDREEFLQTFIERTELIEPTISVRECRDPKDDQFLELAISGKADYLVSGDKDLLTLNPFRGIPILTAEGFLQAVEEGETNDGDS